MRRALSCSTCWTMLPLGGRCCTDTVLHHAQAAAKPSKPAENADAAPKDRNGDDSSGPSRGPQSATAAGSATLGAATAPGGAQGNRGGSAGPLNAAPGSDRRHGTDRRRTGGELNSWLRASPVECGRFAHRCLLSKCDGDLTSPNTVCALNLSMRMCGFHELTSLLTAPDGCDHCDAIRQRSRHIDRR